MPKSKKCLISSIVFAVLFVVLTVLLLTVDRKNTGVSDTFLGLFTINVSVFKAIGSSEIFDKLTDLFLLIAFLVVILELVIACVQLVKRKNFLKIDKSLVFYNVMLFVVVVLYVLFDLFPVNFRPLGVEPSYPSTHVLVSVSILISSLFISSEFIKNAKLNKTFKICAICVAGLSTVLRLFAGVHYLTDIIGGLLLGLAISFVLGYVVNLLREKNNK